LLRLSSRNWQTVAHALDPRRPNEPHDRMCNGSLLITTSRRHLPLWLASSSVRRPANLSGSFVVVMVSSHGETQSKNERSIQQQATLQKLACISLRVHGYSSNEVSGNSDASKTAIKQTARHGPYSKTLTDHDVQMRREWPALTIRGQSD
jgi:hypothetical protein